MTVLFEVRRYLRRGALTALLAGFILCIGFSGSALSWTILRAFSRTDGAGLLPIAFATVARQNGAGGIAPLDWKTLERVRQQLPLQNAQLAGYTPPVSLTLRLEQQTRQVSIAGTEEGFFPRFTTGLYAGHDFAPTWRNPHAEAQIILSKKLSERLFGTSANALNQTVTVSGIPLRVVGIAPRNFNGLWTDTDVWTTPDQISNLGDAGFRATATGLAAQVLSSPERWKVGDRWYLLASSGQLSWPLLAGQLHAAIESAENRPLKLDVVEGLSIDPARDRKARSTSTLVLMIAAALLLAACMNYSSVLLVRSPKQIEEMRLKRILGASTQRILFEAICGPAFVVLSSFFLSIICTLFILAVIRSHELNPIIAKGLGWQTALSVLGWQLPIAILLAVAVGIGPALALLRQSGAPRLGQTATQSKFSVLALECMVTIEITVCIFVCLLAGTIGFLTYRLSLVQIGFNPIHLYSHESSLTSKGGGILTFKTSASDRSPMESFVRQVTDQAVQSTPGMMAISAATCTPMGPPMKTLDIDPMQAGVDSLRGVPFCAVGPNYFTTVEDHIYRGSVFTLSDFDGDIAQVVINRKLADVLWPGKSPVNRTIRLTEPVTGLQFDTQILGIVDDMRSGGAASSTQATIFLPLKGNAFALSFPFWFLARGTYSSHDLESFVQGQAATTMPGMGITRSFSIEDRLQNSWRAQRLRLELGLGGAALLAIIAYLGLYGVLTNAVSSRRRELALRLCFGANAWQLRRIILARAIRCSIAATILSFGSGQLFFRFLNTSWTGGAAWSWQIASATCLVCSFAAIGIAMIPANMAVQISPSQVLKDM
jgi:putative ABC transport system permease protein